ncbi:hypothetical protein BJ170DRAFT_683097 [Xylariales sp. AK1849]|nr:hypothetical protein BJ170DRAFT_683097 [Xylariales sp. AK1849]
MPPHIPQSNSALHLYRHLLREATYLPPLCRPWTSDRIKARFRDCYDAIEAKPYIKQAHRNLRFLRAANAGHVERMRRLCYLATGRLGKRRRQLASAYLTKPPPTDSAALDDGKPPISAAMRQMQAASAKADDEPMKVKKTANTVGHTWLENWDIGMVKAVGQAQVDRQTTKWPNEVRRTVDPKRVLPAENCWGVPLKPKTVTNKHKRFWVTILANLMPPLPQGEWDALKDLTLGQAEESTWRIAPRRPVAVSTDGIDDVVIGVQDIRWDWEKYATKSVRDLEKRNSRSRKILSAGVDEDPRGQGRPIGVRTFKPRMLRRSIYGPVWEASPIVKKDPKGKWNITYGIPDIKISHPSASELDFFRGVDRKGAQLKSV